MKRWHIALIIYSLCIDAYTLDKIYQELTKNGSFRGLSFLEIAVDRHDNEAIQHFLLSADTESITKAINLLNQQIDFIRSNITDLNQTKKAYPLGTITLQEKKKSLYRQIQQLENLIASAQRALEQKRAI